MSDEFKLPDEITEAENLPPRDLVIISIPKAGKGTILGAFTRKYNALVVDMEKGGYDYISARKISTYTSQDTTRWEAFQNYVKYRKMLLENKGKYEYIIIDGISDLDDLSEIGGTLAYMKSPIGKNFNRPKLPNNTYGEPYHFNDPEWMPVTSLPEGYGYQHTRQWFMQQVEIFKQIAPYRIWAAHLGDKYIKDNGKEQVVGSELALTGQLKRIFASKVTSMAKLVVEDEERWLNFQVQNESIVAGSRAPMLTGKMLISRRNADKSIDTFWETIYPK